MFKKYILFCLGQPPDSRTELIKTFPGSDLSVDVYLLPPSMLLTMTTRAASVLPITPAEEQGSAAAQKYEAK